MRLDITIAITSCGRIDLLKKTILSLSKGTDLSLYRKILTEDSPDPSVVQRVKDEHIDGFLQDWTILFTGGSGFTSPYASHLAALQKLYASIETPYVFHCEDDWKFVDPGFDYLDLGMKILDDNPLIGTVLYRNYFSTNAYNVFQSKQTISNERFLSDLVSYFGHDFRKLKNIDHATTGPGLYNGFTLNPGVRRLTQMQKILSAQSSEVDEKAMGKLYYDMKLHSIVIEPPLCHHLGGGINSTAFFKDGFFLSIFRAIKNGLIYYATMLLKGKS